LIASLGVMLAIILGAQMAAAPQAQAGPTTPWVGFSQSAGTASVSGSHRWYKSRYDYNGGIEQYGTLKDTKIGDTDHAKFRLRVEGYNWWQWTAKNGNTTLPDKIYYQPEKYGLTSDASWQTCQGRILWDICSTVKTEKRPAPID